MPRDTLRHCYKVLNDAGYWWERVDIMQRYGRRKDFGGFADILCWHLDRPGILAIQSCTENHKNPHIEKLRALPRVIEWLGPDRRLELWTWCRRKRNGKDKLILKTYQMFILDAEPNYLQVEPEQTEVLCPTHPM